MKIYISHSIKDAKICSQLAEALSEAGYDVDIYEESATGVTGENIIETIKNRINASDLVIAVITENFTNSSWAQAEISAVTLGNIEKNLLPIVVGDIFIPSFISNFIYKKVESIKEVIPIALAEVARMSHAKTTKNFFEKRSSIADELVELDEKIRLLKKALDDNQLTLVCGAGVSISSGIPNWNELLVRILNRCILNANTNDEEQVDSSVISAEDLLADLPSSNLILGKYLRILLKDGFEDVVRKCLYDKVWFNDLDVLQKPSASDTSMMEAIIEMARPKRNKKGIESIITFNFDDLIEASLIEQHIKHRPIWKDGQNYEADELPIYHVHGYLPQHGKLDSPNLVFSEEAYHSQFIDPYSWANLVQLNAFSSNICLFVGLSLSDPNLRRLLDISWRKNVKCRHFIISKRPKPKKTVDKITTTLYEQDANLLGLNVIWVSEFSDIPDIIKKIAE